MTDKLKPVRCGCGGEAKINQTSETGFAVYCERCVIHTGLYHHKEDAIKAWNTAMGEKTVKVIREKLEEDVTIGAFTFHKGTNVISKCSCDKWVRIGDKYCSECGAKLDWSGE